MSATCFLAFCLLDTGYWLATLQPWHDILEEGSQFNFILSRFYKHIYTMQLQAIMFNAMSAVTMI